jgi:hypothetical protein
MTRRICEHCGQQFLSETIFNKLENIGYPALTIFGPFSAVDCFMEHSFLAGFVWLALVGGAIYEMVKRHREKEGWTVKLGRACPSCGNRTAQFDSPLGEQLIEKWSSPETIDPKRVNAEQSIVQSAEDEVLERSSDNPGENCVNHP